MKTFTKNKVSAATRTLALVSFLTTLCCILLSFGSFAQKPDCGSINCTANDVQIVKAYISGLGGAAITCPDGGGNVDGYLHVVLSTNTPRKGVSVSGDLIIDGVLTPIGACFNNDLNGSNNDFVFPGVFQITCTSSVSLSGTLVSWGVGNTQFCTGTGAQCPATKSKCRYTQASIPVPIKLEVFFDWLAGDCSKKENGLAVKFTPSLSLENVTVTGYSWDFGDNTGTSTDESPTYTYVSAGTYNVKLTVTGKSDVDNSEITKSITLPVTVATCCILTPPQLSPFTYCELEGKKFGDLPQTDGDGGFYNWFDADDNALDPNAIIPVGEHTYYVTLAKGDCESEKASVTVTITAKRTPTFDPIAAVCSGGTITLPTESKEGIKGTWSPAVDNTKTTEYTFTPDDGQCATTAKLTVTVNSKPTVTASNPDAVCEPGTVDLANAITSDKSGLTFTYYVQDGANWKLLPSSVVNKSGTYKIVGTTEAQCSAEATVTVTVNPLPTATINYAGPYCATGTASVTQTGQANGTYSSTPSGLSLNTSTGAINLGLSNAGLYTVKYDFTDGTCPNSTTTTVTIKALPTVSIGVDAQTCTGGIAQFKLTATTNGTSFTWSKPAGADGSFSSTNTSPITYTPGPLDRKNGVVITLTAYLDGCSKAATTTLTTSPCGPFYTYTQGYYSSTGTSCTPVGGKRGAVALIQYALDNTDGNIGNSTGQLVLGKAGASFTIKYADASRLVAIMPGGGTATKLAKDYDLDPLTTSIPSPPLKNGKIDNVLLSQTITLGLNINIQGDGLANFVLQTGYLTTQKGDISNCPITKVVPCSKDKSSISSLQITTSTGLKNWITTAPTKTVKDLFNLASAALGGTLPSNVTYTDINNAVDVINKSFDQGKFALGYFPTQQSCTSLPAFKTLESPNKLEEVTVTKLTVSAFPNPFTDKIRFTIQSPKGGRARLEVYNMLGQKVGVPFEGVLNANETRNVEYTAPVNSGASLIYTLRMNGEQVNGKLISIKR